MKLFLCLFLVTGLAYAAAPSDLPKTKAELFGLPVDFFSKVSTKAKSSDVKGVVCDVSGYSDGDVLVAPGDVRDNGVIVGFAPAIPWEDVADNHRRALRVLNAIAERQDKGGPYSVEIGSFRKCDGGAMTKITDGSIVASGITAKGSTEIVDVWLEQARQVNNDRYKKRVKEGKKFVQDHVKAPKSRRDDLGRKVRD